MDKQLIDRLADEAGDNWVSSTNPGALYAFARLLAKECAKVAEATTEQGAPDNNCETKAYAAAAAILEKFAA